MRVSEIFLIAGLFCACTKTEQASSSIETESTQSEVKSELPPEPPLFSPAKQTSLDEELKGQTLLKFDKLTLAAQLGEIWSDSTYLNQIHQDTIVVELGLDFDISGQTYTIKLDSSIQRIEVFQNYETSLTIMNEGPHLDLIDWKHYIDEWRRIEVLDNKFKTHEYSVSDFEKFPNSTTTKIYEAVKKRLDITDETNEWIALAKKCSSPTQYPCGVSVSRVNLKIVLTDQKGIKSAKFLIFELPMGC